MIFFRQQLWGLSQNIERGKAVTLLRGKATYLKEDLSGELERRCEIF